MPDGAQSTPLHWAAASNQLEVARLLVELGGANLLAKDDSDFTPVRGPDEDGRPQQRLACARVSLPRPCLAPRCCH